MSIASRRRRRRQSIQAARQKAGAPPGTAIYTGETLPDTPITVQILDYDPESVQELEAANTNELGPYQTRDRVTWINLDGIHRAEEVQALGKAFGVHPLWIEDVLNPTSRPKAEVYQDRVLVITRMALTTDDPNNPVNIEQVSLVLGPGWVLTFQEHPGDVWGAVRDRIRAGGGRVRRRREDYLLHALLDAVVDHYFTALEALEAQVDALEDEALSIMDVDLKKVYALKGELAAFRQVVWPTREAVGALLRVEGEAIQPETVPYFRDLYDHVVQVMDILETSRERVMSAFELHLAITGHRLNEIMRVLTVVSTVFIPLTFIAGVYGMNFRYMPELDQPWAYPAVWVLMLSMAAGMGIWFKTRRWM